MRYMRTPPQQGLRASGLRTRRRQITRPFGTNRRNVDRGCNAPSVQIRPPKDQDPKRCRLCGEERPLTFEHIPPRAAYNRGRVSMLGIEAWLAHDADPDGPAPKRRIQQRGSGAYSLCAECNNLTGRLYVPELRAWVQAGAEGLFGNPGLAAQFREEQRTVYAEWKLQSCRPGRFLKQVATMLLAMSPPGLGDRFPELRNYARDPGKVGLPTELQFYLALYAGPNSRYVAGGAEASLDGGGIHHVYELAAPPFAYILSLAEQTPAIEAGNISNFATVGIDDTANVEMQMIIGYGETPFPLDFRSPAAMRADIAASEAAMGA